MSDLLEPISKIAVLIFVVTSMATAGLGLQVREIAAPFRRPRLALFALFANFVIAPLTAYGLTELIPLDQPYAVALLLLGGAAGAPFLPKLAELARGDIAYSVALMLMLTIGSVIFMPLALPLMIPGLEASPWPIAKPLLVTMVLPLALAMLVRRRSERWASQLQPAFRLASNISVLLAVVLLIGLNFQAMIGAFGNGAAATAVLFVSICLAAGYLLGGPSPAIRSVCSLGTGQRNIAAALVIASRNFNDPGVAVMLLIATFAGVIVELFVARRLARQVKQAAMSQESFRNSNATASSLAADSAEQSVKGSAVSPTR